MKTNIFAFHEEKKKQIAIGSVTRKNRSSMRSNNKLCIVKQYVKLLNLAIKETRSIALWDFRSIRRGIDKRARVTPETFKRVRVIFPGRIRCNRGNLAVTKRPLEHYKMRSLPCSSWHRSNLISLSSKYINGFQTARIDDTSITCNYILEVHLEVHCNYISEQSQRYCINNMSQKDIVTSIRVDFIYSIACCN